jgi:UV DNA damage endonuclease
MSSGQSNPSQPRLGLCCSFADVPIRFRTTTAQHLTSLAPRDRGNFLGELCLANATALLEAVDWCARNGVGAFRIVSQFFPLYTHPEVGYHWENLLTAPRLASTLRLVRERARDADVRLSFHPDQFVVLGSTSTRVQRASVRELEYQSEVADLVGAEQLTIHGGGAQGGKARALARLVRGFDRLSARARELVVLENDDRIYTVEDLLPVARATGARLVYDVHHHRCNPDGLTVEAATAAAAETWGAEEPWAHVSSPAEGWRGPNPRPHHDRIFLRDFPASWRRLRITVDVEAKAKEKAVLALQRALGLTAPQALRPPRPSHARRAS